MKAKCVFASFQLPLQILFLQLQMLFKSRGVVLAPRLGPQSGWSNVEKAQCHCAATALQLQCMGSVHENAVGYDSSYLKAHFSQEVELSV